MSPFPLILLLALYFLCAISTFLDRLQIPDGIPSHQIAKIHQFMTYQTAAISVNTVNQIQVSDIPIIYITSFGGDPTGKNDSTTAFIDAINHALTYGAPNASYEFGVKDLGGVTIDLGGGDYIISKPLLIPSNYGNLRIIHGTIRASSNYEPVNSYLINIGDNINAGNCNGNECNQNIAIQDMELDCKHICDGGIKLYYAQMTSIGPNIFIIGFNTAGIQVLASGGTMIFNAYLAEYMPGDSNKHKAKSTAIQMFTHDSYITNVVVFNAAIGVHLNGSALVLTGIHIWGLTGNSQITNITDQIGMFADGWPHDVRILDCYFDWNHLVVLTPVYALSVENTFFLGGGGLIFKASSSKSVIQSFNMKDSMYDIGPPKINTSTIFVDESNGNKITRVNNMIIDGMQLFHGWNAQYMYLLKTSSTQRTLKQMNATKWVFDFNDVLLFDNIGIANIDYSIKIEKSSKNKFVQHYAMIDEEIDDKTVIIYTDKLCDATIYIKVDQSTYDPYAQI